MRENIPLVVDVDGSLLATDTLLEGFWRGLATAPVKTLRAAWGLWRSPAQLKAALVAIASPDTTHFPIRDSVLAAVRAAQNEGRDVILASGAHHSIVTGLGERLGLAEPHLGSTSQNNMTANVKAAALVARFGEKRFDYIGDSRADLPVWQVARTGYVVAPNARMKRAVAGLSLQIIDAARGHGPLLRAMRPHQWIKNSLLLLPIFAAHQFNLTTLLAVLLGIVAFSAAASAIYIVNDLLDLPADRRHAVKRNRPFAAGTAKISDGMALGLLLVALALALGAYLSPAFVGLIFVYMLVSVAYSLWLKRLRWVDLFVLATLYTLRVVAGAVAGGLLLSGWLTNFVFAVFLALACVKRMTELARAKDEETLPGRGYAKRDALDLRNIAVVATVAATVVFVLYSYSGIAAQLYQRPWMLRAAAIVVPFWLGRMIVRGWRGDMDYDPIVEALRDIRGLAMLGAAMVVVLNAV